MDKFVEVMKAIGSICRGRDCSACQFSREQNGWDVGCPTFMVQHPEEALIKVNKWVDDNTVRLGANFSPNTVMIKYPMKSGRRSRRKSKTQTLDMGLA